MDTLAGAGGSYIWCVKSDFSENKAWFGLRDKKERTQAKD